MVCSRAVGTGPGLRRVDVLGICRQNCVLGSASGTQSAGAVDWSLSAVGTDWVHYYLKVYILLRKTGVRLLCSL